MPSASARIPFGSPTCATDFSGASRRHSSDRPRSSQFHDGDRFAASLFGLKGLPRHQRMRLEEFGQSSAQRAGSVAVNNAHTRLAGQRRLVQNFVDSLGTFFSRPSNQIDFFTPPPP